MHRLIQLWMTEKFPLIHLKDNTSIIKKWLIHPIKRRLARYYLRFLQKYTDIKVIGITGSAGKTSVKEFLGSILSIKGKTIVSKDNIDPIYNIPSTILRTPIGAKYLVLEMGIEYIGEMDFYLWLVKPDIGVITNIFPTHLKYLKNVEGVLEEKSKLVTSLSKDKIVVLNEGDKLLKSLANKIKANIVWVKKVKNPFSQNGNTATYVARLLGLSLKDINKGLDSYKKPPHRMNWLEHKSGAIILDDSYNSNPEAFLRIFKTFVDRAGNNEKVAVIGDMLELGEQEEYFHRQVGKEISKHNFQAIIGVGKLSKFLLDEVKLNNHYSKVYQLENSNEVLPILNGYLIKDFYIFIKGSHSIGLDKVVDKLV